MDPFDEREKRALFRAVSVGVENPACQRCGGRCSVIRTRARPDISYIRDLVVIRCSGCMRTLALDVRRLEERID